MKSLPVIYLLAVLLSITISCSSSESSTIENLDKNEKSMIQLEGFEKAYFASGCFWCVEAIFENVKGVEEVVSGYSGGTKVDPTYQEICTGKLKHAEAVVVYYDSEIIDYKTLLKVFFGSHDPTTFNRQGPDAGPQYRSIVFYQNPEEKLMTENYIKELEALKVYSSPIVTEVVPFDIFYQAEDYHQDYEKLNPNNSYVKAVSVPRLLNFESKYPELLKVKH